MGSDNNNLTLWGLPADIGDYDRNLIESAARLDGAILLFDRDDRVVFANERQRERFACCDYDKRTYSEFFWGMHACGMLGSAAARSDPASFLAVTLVERANVPKAHTFYEYPGLGLSTVSNRHLDNGMGLQLRHLVGSIDASDPDIVLMKALQAQRDLEALKLALNSLDVGVAIVDRQGAVLYRNEGLADVPLLIRRNGTLAPIWPGDVAGWRQAVAGCAGGAIAKAFLRDRDGAVVAVAAMCPGQHAGTIVIRAALLKVALQPGAAEWLGDLGVRASEVQALDLVLQGCSTDEVGALLHRDAKTVNGQLARARGALRSRDLIVDGQNQLLTLAMRMSAVTRAPGR